MRIIAILSLLLLSSPAFGELTKEDIRTIMKEENNASEKRLKEYIDLKIETVNARIDATNARIDALDKSLNARIDALDKSLNARIDNVKRRIDESDGNLTDRIRDIWLLVLALIGLLAAAIAIPQLIIAYREKGHREMQTQIDQLREKLEAMQQ